MKLLDWMRREGIDDEAMAARVNEGLPPGDHITASAVKKWKYGERQAPSDKVVRIEEITQRDVTLRDLIQPSGLSPEPAAARP